MYSSVQIFVRDMWYVQIDFSHDSLVEFWHNSVDSIYNMSIHGYRYTNFNRHIDCHNVMFCRFTKRIVRFQCSIQKINYSRSPAPSGILILCRGPKTHTYTPESQSQVSRQVQVSNLQPLAPVGDITCLRHCRRRCRISTINDILGFNLWF